MVAAKNLERAATPDELISLLWSQSLAREHGFEPLRVEGTLPQELRGTLFRNGPGQFEQFGTRYTHPFEADGAATAIRFEQGAAFGASRVHQTAGLREERAAGKPLYGQSLPWRKRFVNGLRGRFKNTANTSVMTWQGRVFALLEAARPTEIDPTDLTTIGETDLGVIGPMFSAHPHRVASRKALYNFGLEYGRVTKLGLYELPDVGAAKKLGTVELGGAVMLHDFIATDHHLVFFVSPVRLTIPKMLLGIGDFADMWKWKPQLGTEVIVVPFTSLEPGSSSNTDRRPTEVTRFTTDAFYQWHFANAVSLENDTIEVDYVRYPNFDTFYEFGGDRTPSPGRYHRATIDLRAKTLRSEQLSDQACEFPTLVPGTEGRAHDVAYVVFDNLGALGSISRTGTITTHTLPADERCTEPLYVGGYLLSLCHAVDRAYVAVYDAAKLPNGPVAKVHLDHYIPLTFHGTFLPRA